MTRIQWKLQFPVCLENRPYVTCSKIPHTGRVIEGEKLRKKTTTPDENLLSTAADRGTDTKEKYNNQPYKRFNAYLGRMTLRIWADWKTVALLASHLVRGPFLRLWILVDCCELHFLVQKKTNKAETFAYERQ